MRILTLAIILVAVLSGCSRWSVERYDAETAARIDEQVPVGMTMREFRERVYAAQDAAELYALLESQEVAAS